MNKETVSGEFYRTTLQKQGGQFIIIQAALLSYLSPSETKVWLELCRRASMTTFKDGTFIASLEEIGIRVGLKKRRLITVMESLQQIGFITKYDNVRKNKYLINHSSLKILLDVLTLNPLIGWELRNIRDSAHINFIKNSEVKEACKASKVPFKRCVFLIS